MTPETSRLIAETLRLDGEATTGPWNHIEGDGSVWNDDDMGRCVANTDHCANMNMDINAELIASYRASAPRLARIAKMQSEYIEWAANPCYSTAPSWLATALVGAERQALPLQHVARYVLTEIERIAKGETDGIESSNSKIKDYHNG